MPTSTTAPSGHSNRPLGWRLLAVLDSSPGTLLLSLLITLLMMYNYIFPLGSLLFDGGIKGQDCFQMIWNLWFANEAITGGHSPLSTNLIFYPLGANLGHHTLAAGFFPITFLVKKLSGNDPLYPFYAFKLIILFSLTLILWLSYLVLRELRLTRWAALIAALGYTFSDFYMLHVLHINHLAGFFIPLTTLFLIRAFRQPASGNLLKAVLAAACSVYFTEFSIFICMGVVFIVLAACLWRSGRRELLAKAGAAGGRRLVTAGLVFLVIVAPFAINLSRDKIVNPPAAEVSHYSANLAGFFIPGREPSMTESDYPLPSTPLYGGTFTDLNYRITTGIGGFEVFVGFPLLLFSIVALCRSRDRFFWLCVSAGLLFFVLSLGPTLKILGTDTGWRLPYSLLMLIPPFNASRTPVRFVVMGLFFLMVVAAYGLTEMQRLVTVRWGRRQAWLLLLLVAGWTVLEVYSPTQGRRPPFVPPPGLAKVIPGPVLDLRPVLLDGYGAMLQTFHHQPIGSGYLARQNLAQLAQFSALKTAFDKGGEPFCDYVKSQGFRNLMIEPDWVTLPDQSSLEPLELSRCAVNVVDLRDDLKASTGYPSYRAGTRLDFGAYAYHQYLGYGWSVREGESHWTDRGRATVNFAWEFSGENKQQLRLRLFAAPFVAPGKLEAQHVIVKLNDSQIADWQLTGGETQELSVALPTGVLRDQNILMFILPDAASPQSLGVSDDSRLLGLNVHWLEID